MNELLSIPGVGRKTVEDFELLGIHSLDDLRRQDPEILYQKICEEKGYRLDPCVLYVFRCAVYFAVEKCHDPEKLKWWSWKDRAYQNPLLKNPVFSLEYWDEKFIEDVAHFANNQKIAAFLRDGFPYPYTLENARFYVAACIQKEADHQVTRAIVINNRAAGSIGVFQKSDVYRKSAELGYWLGEEFWGQGIMTEAVKQICSLAFSSLDIVRISAEPFASNLASRKVLEKAGFSLEGILQKRVFKNGKLLDSCIYAKILRDA